jgi:hypothetical protein
MASLQEEEDGREKKEQEKERILTRKEQDM